MTPYLASLQSDDPRTGGAESSVRAQFGGAPLCVYARATRAVDVMRHAANTLLCHTPPCLRETREGKSDAV